jgi:hypothetical protein
MTTFEEWFENQEVSNGLRGFARKAWDAGRDSLASANRSKGNRHWPDMPEQEEQKIYGDDRNRDPGSP